MLKNKLGPDLKSIVLSPKIKCIKKTEVYNTYWKFSAYRQNIFFKKLTLPVPPFTQDPILTQYKFTNVYRASDRVSQYLIRNVIYTGSQKPCEVFFRLILFKIFNRIETWEYLKNQLGGEITLKNYSFDRYDSLLRIKMENGGKLYSAAYILPSGKREFGNSKKHQNNLRLIEMMLKNNLPEKILRAKSLKKIYELLLDFPTIGSFLAYQYAIDVAYSELTEAEENEFVVPGPGARDGIRKCFSNTGGLSESDLIQYMVDNQEKEFERLGLTFKTLWGRPLHLIDCQNLFCEVDKYSRVRHPEIVGISGRTRIKQKYVANKNPIQYWYPPKWNINHLIPKISAQEEVKF